MKKATKFYKFRCIIPRSVKIKLAIMFIGIIVGAQIETLTLAAVQPFVLVLTDSTVIYTNSSLNFMYNLVPFGGATGFLAFLSGSIAAIYAFRGLYVFFFTKIKSRFLATNSARMSNRLLMQTLKQPYLYHVSTNVAQAQRVIMRNSERLFALIGAIMSLLIDGLMAIFMLAFLMIASFSMTLVVLFFASVCIVVYFRVFKRRIQSSGEDEARGAVMINKSVLQAMGGVREIKMSQRETHFTDKHNEITSNTVNVRVQIQSLRQLPKLFIESLCFSGAFIAMGAIILGGVDVEALVPQLGIFMLAAFKLLPAISRIVNNITQILRFAPSIDLVYAGLFEQERKYAKLLDEPELCENPSEDIVVSEVSFKYPEGESNVLKKVSLTIPKNKSVAFIGPSGAGKSTLIDIILGILPPKKGYVFWKGKSIHHNFGEWAKNVGYIPQVIYLMDETIIENVAFGLRRDEIDEERVWLALQQAQAAEFVSELSDGLYTMVGERGVRLSGGQRQRIGIARALYNNPPILVLDEATSSLDNETETAVMESIRNLQGEKTMIIVAHRLSTIEHCDLVYSVKNTKVKQKKGELL